MAEKGNKTCPNCTQYRNCEDNDLIRTLLKRMYQNSSAVKRITVASNLAEVCPKYFANKDSGE